MQVIKCPQCHKCYFEADICPHCGWAGGWNPPKDGEELPDFLKDIFGSFQKDDKRKD